MLLRSCVYLLVVLPYLDSQWVSVPHEIMFNKPQFIWSITLFWDLFKHGCCYHCLWFLWIFLFCLMYLCFKFHMGDWSLHSIPGPCCITLLWKIAIITDKLSYWFCRWGYSSLNHLFLDVRAPTYETLSILAHFVPYTLLSYCHMFQPMVMVSLILDCFCLPLDSSDSVR